MEEYEEQLLLGEWEEEGVSSHTRFEVGDESMVRFWHDLWGYGSKRCLSSFICYCLREGCHWIAALISPLMLSYHDLFSFLFFSF
jgi:hypothetical protein